MAIACLKMFCIDVANLRLYFKYFIFWPTGNNRNPPHVFFLSLEECQCYRLLDCVDRSFSKCFISWAKQTLMYWLHIGTIVLSLEIIVWVKYFRKLFYFLCSFHWTVKNTVIVRKPINFKSCPTVFRKFVQMHPNNEKYFFLKTHQN